MEAQDAKKTVELAEAVKSAALALLNDMVAHKIKGADILLQSTNLAFDYASETYKWVEDLKKLLIALKPLYEQIKEWIGEVYAHLVQILEWAKEKWEELF